MHSTHTPTGGDRKSADHLIDLEAARERLVHRRIDEDEARWDRVRDQLIVVMVASSLSSIGLASATLRALLDVLIDDGMSMADAKQEVSASLRAFFEKQT